jgi:hypothetical protein
MNALLWRAEFGPSRNGGAPVPIESVWRRILTAPDESALEIQRHGERIGYCHWVAGAAEEMVLEPAEPASGLPEGMVRRPTAYAVHLEGGILSGDVASRARFKLGLKLTSEQVWQELTLSFGTRPALWEIRASATTQTVELRYGPDGGAWSRQFTFAQLRQPRALLEELGGPAGLALAPLLGGLPAADSPSWALDWDARTDWVKIGGTRDRAYRIRLRLLDRHEAVLLVSRVGEILRVDLPDGVALVNEVLTNF